MIDPKQKALEIVETYAEEIPKLEFGVLIESDWETAKKCAKIHVEGIIDANPYYFYPNRKVTRISDHSTKDSWQEVLNELNNL